MAVHNCFEAEELAVLTLVARVRPEILGLQGPQLQ